MKLWFSCSLMKVGLWDLEHEQEAAVQNIFPMETWWKAASKEGHDNCFNSGHSYWVKRQL